MIAVYLRTSTEEQNLETQRGVIRDWLAGREARWFEDDGYSGDTINRPAFRELRQSKLSHVVVFRLDRISRKTATGVAILHRWLESDIRVTSVMESLDIDPSNHAVVDIVVPLLFGLAANEQRVRRQRQRAGIDRAKREGRYSGRKRGTTIGDPNRAAELRAKGLSLAEIGVVLGVSKATVCRYLSSSTHI